MIKNLFPQDTRAVEIASAWALLVTAVGVLSGRVINLDPLIAIHPPQFWSLLFLCFGAMQLTTLLLYPTMDILRCITSWVAGTFWLWIGLNHITSLPSVSAGASITLGAGNLYAFVIAYLSQRASWKS